MTFLTCQGLRCDVFTRAAGTTRCPGVVYVYWVGESFVVTGTHRRLHSR